MLFFGKAYLFDPFIHLIIRGFCNIMVWKYFKIIWVFILVGLMASCSKKEAEPVKEKTGVEIKSLGSINFGGVLLGEFKDAAIQVINHGPGSVPVDLTIPSPFSIASVSQSCTTGVLVAKASCIISIRFTPSDSEPEGFSATYSVGGSSVTARGRGLSDGFLELNDDGWNVGSVIAGSVNRKFFTLTNLGDLTVATPIFDMPSFIKIGQNGCGFFIPPRSSCQFQLEATPTVARIEDFDISLIGDGGTIAISFDAQVSPAAPAGLITFEAKPLSMDAAGEEFLVKTNEIKDEFGNVVKDNEVVSVSANEHLLLLDGINYTTTSGKVSFRIRTVTTKGTGAVSVSSGQASGFVSFPVTSGVAFGNIGVREFTSTIPANGITQVVINTDIIKDQFSNIVEDGTEVIFQLQGSGSVSSNVNNPKEFINRTSNGETFVVVRAGTLAENATLLIKSGPIYDNLNQLVGYSANGSVNINFIPGPGAGAIDVNPTIGAIYSVRNPPNDITIPSNTLVSIGPIKDLHNNIVAPGTEVNVNITNGFNISGSQPLSNSVITTDIDGFAFFTLVGNGTRGYINVDISSGLGSGSTQVWGYLRSRINYSAAKPEDVQMYFRHGDASEKPMVGEGSRWAKLVNSTPLEALDGVFLGHEKQSSPIRTNFASNEGVPYFNWDCFFTGDVFLFSSFCREEDGFFAPLLRYGPNHSITYDSLSDNNNQELLFNGKFSPELQSQGWDTSAGGAWSNSFSGTMGVDNSSSPPSGQRKKRAESNWIEIDDNKKYVISLRMVGRFGTDAAGDGEVGIIESPGDLFEDPAFEPPYPTLYLQDLNQSDLNLEKRIIYTPTSGVEAIRIYMSTKGFGNGAITYWDDVSVKELANENFHDNLVSEGPMIAFMEQEDRALIIGGSAEIEEVGPSFYGRTSDVVTMLDRILDTSIGVVKSIQDPSGPMNYGDIPSSRSHGAHDARENYVYLYGGYDNSSSEGSARDDLFVFDNSTVKWSQIEVEKDSLLYDPITDLGGAPGARYQHGLLYLPEYDRLYVGGGLEMEENGTGDIIWSARDDLWKVDLSQETKEWFRLCDDCGLFSSNPYSILSLTQKPLEDFPEIPQRYLDYKQAARDVKRTKFLWHEATQTAYMYVPETNHIMGLDPYSDTFFNNSSVLSPTALLGVSNPYQILYNRALGRTYVYQRGVVGGNDSKIFYWDMNPDEKQYVRASVKLDSSAKQFLNELKITAYAYGSSFTERGTGDIITGGVEMYLYNHFNNSWRPLATSTSSTSSSAQSQPVFAFINDVTLTNYVDDDGRVDILLVPAGRPGFDGGEVLMGDDLIGIDLGNNNLDTQYEVKDVSTMNQSSCAILEDDRVKCWGKNDLGQLGRGVSSGSEGEVAGEMGDNLLFTELFDEDNPSNASLVVSKLFSGSEFSCALFNNKRIKCWGANESGQLGIGDNTNRGSGFADMGDNLPFVDLGTKDGTIGTAQVEVEKISLGSKHGCAMVKVADFGTVNRVKCWGLNNEGQLGLGHNNTRGTSPAHMGSSLPFISLGTIFDSSLSQVREVSVKDISVGANHSCAVLEDDVVKCWGANASGQLGQGDQLSSNIPLGLDINLDTVSSIVSGNEHTCALGTFGGIEQMKCWGANASGQLGVGDTNNRGDNSGEMSGSLPSVMVASAANILQISAGAEHTCVLLDNELTKCFGSNIFGQLSYGPDTDYFGISLSQMGDNLLPVDLGDGAFVKYISTGGNNSCAILADNSLKCWGANGFGQLGQGDQRNRGRGLPISQGRNNLQIDFIEVEGVF